MSQLRRHLSYANVMATVAAFVALGGTSYAVVSLPRNSVGSRQIRSGAVGGSELKARSVQSKHIRDRSIALRDLSLGARSALRGAQGAQGPQGPQGPGAATYGVAVNRAGQTKVSLGGSFGTSHLSGDGVYDVAFGRDLTGCLAVASLSRVPGTTPDAADNGEIVTSTTSTGVTVKTRNSAGSPTDLPFHLIVVC
jgi:hypothetical protein